MLVLSAGLVAGPTQVDAASARGSASATVITPSVISISSVSVVVPSPNVVVSSGASSMPSVSSVSTASGGPAGTASDVMTVAGVQVTPVDGGSALSFSMGGDTTSSYVLQLSSTAPQGGGAGAAAGGSSLIVSPPPLSGNGRLAVVLSQAPSDLTRDAVSLTVNFN